MGFKKFLEEQKEKHGVLAFGRMNPPTTGHEVLVNKVKEIAKKVGGSHHIVLSHSQDKDKNPLTSAQKVKHAKRYFPDTNISVATKEKPNFLSQASELHKKGVTHLHMVAGSDRVGEYHKLLHKYNGVKGPHGHFNFKHIEVHSAGERDPDAEGTAGMSASKMRSHAAAGEFHHFKKGIPSHVPEHHAKELYNDVRKGMGIKESIDDLFNELLIEGVHDKAIFKAVFLGGGPGSGKDFVLSKTLEGQGLTEINSDKALEFLMDKNNLDMRMPASEKEARDVVRSKAKSMIELKQKLALLGRNGLIINGTGDDAAKIKKIKERLDQLGYESSMIMVNTRDEISAARNVERGARGGRTVPEEIRKQKWDAVQKARPELAKIFGDNYSEFDNSEDLRSASPDIRAQKEQEMLELFKTTQKFISKPPKNDISKQWIADEMQKKDTSPIQKGEKSVQPHPDSKAADQARSMGLQYYGFGRYGKNGKVTHRSVHDKLVDVSKNINEDVESFLTEAVTISVTGDTPEEVTSVLQKMLLTSNPDVNKEQYSGSDSLNVLTLGKSVSVTQSRTDSSTITNDDVESILENEKEKDLLKDKNGKVRIFMLRASAAKEAHQKNGIVYPYKNGYVIKLNEEKQNDIEILKEPIFVRETTGSSIQSGDTASQRRIALSEIRANFSRRIQATTGIQLALSEDGARTEERMAESCGDTKGREETSTKEILTEEAGFETKSTKITLAKIRAKQNEKG